ncbi:sulfatase-like hydrolase/transferase [Winogradskyella sp. PE311]|uniref:sulfatase-like hydrolase/transferase n=1 Tax=Winogradskyella sp. PE311 TaxID=3366943 RepID=UPI0039817EB5
MKAPQIKLAIIVLTFIFSCSNNDDSITEQETPASNKPNILLIIADDMGLDATPSYGIGNLKPNMPTLQSWINSGIKFNNLWSNPTCTPTRGTIITGKYGFRTGVTEVGNTMAITEVSIQTYLDNTNSGYNHAVIGKWHLANNNASHPTNMGVGYYAGNLGGGVPSYTSWNLTENAQTNISTAYVTTKYTDLAIDWIDNQSQPWFLWLAYNAAHTPFHLPPNSLHSQGNLPSDQASIDANPLPYYLAMLEAMDTEMGRLVSSMSDAERENTVIIFIGDNGTPNQVAQEYQSNRVKGSLFQGGINVPMVIAGKNVTRVNAIEDALINTTDLFATIAELSGNSTPEIHDSKSFKDLLTSSNANIRDYIYAERGSIGSQDYTIRNATHKYLLNNGIERFYNLINDPLETTNLLNTNQLPLSTEDTAIKDALIAELNIIRN